MSETEASHSPAINTIMFADSNRGRALFTHSFYKTADGGKEWAKGLDVYGDFYHDFTFVTDADGWMVGTRTNNYEPPYNPLILRTSDGGATWREQKIKYPQTSLSLPQPLTGVSFCGPRTGWAVGANMIVHTTNGGDSWEVQHLGYSSEKLQSVICVSPARAWAVGNDGLMLYTNDGGSKWTTQESGTDKILLRARLFDDNVWVVGRDGTLLQTNGDGAKWVQHQTGSVEALYDIYLTGSTGWIVGNKGTILHTLDGGATWKKQANPTENNLRTLHFINPQDGWAGGEFRTLLRFSN